MLDAILCPEWQYRYYGYNQKWADGEEMASMRNGCGDGWFLLFNHQGAALKGFAKESPLAASNAFVEQIRKTIPTEFDTFLNEAAFSMDQATFCFWRRHSDNVWNIVTLENDSSLSADGSHELIGIFDGNPITYQKWAEAYYGCPVPLPAVQEIYAHEPITKKLLEMLSHGSANTQLLSDLTEIGYPHALLA